MESIRKNKLAITVFMLPAVILFAGIIIIPIIMSFIYSLQDWNGITEPKFIGFDNYIELFTSKSAGFPKTTLNALLLAVLSVFIQLPLSLALALMISKGIKGERFFMTVFFIPVLMSTVVIGQLWLKIYNPNYGVLNVLLDKIGLHSLAKTAWLAEPKTVLLAAFLPNLWQYVGYHMLLMYAGIKSVSPDVIEAAKIDGAGHFRTFLVIVIPLAKPIIAVMALYYAIGQWNSYFNAMIFLQNEKLYPLQLVLKEILLAAESTMGGSGETILEQYRLATQIKYVSVIVSSLPVLMLYPFVQKYFEQGIMIGSLKE